MKKIIIVLFFLIVLLVFINEKKMLLIPNESIRFRVIANSNSTLDQDLKLSVKNDVEKELYNIIGNSKNIGEARNRIRNNIDKVNDILNKYNISYDISYGNNYFPEKEYKGVKYSEGEYESVVITIGNGLGHNWWCVLFPPLCLLDEKDNLDDIEYEFYARELINKIK